MARPRSVQTIAPPLETHSPLASLPSHFNLRDLGGTATADGRVVAPGRLYRGASMHRLEADHLEAVRGRSPTPTSGC